MIFRFKQSFSYKLFPNILINYKGKTINVCTMSSILHWFISLHYKAENQNIWSRYTVGGHVILLISAHFYLSKWESYFLSFCGTQYFYKVVKNNMFLAKVVYLHESKTCWWHQKWECWQVVKKSFKQSFVVLKLYFVPLYALYTFFFFVLKHSNYLQAVVLKFIRNGRCYLKACFSGLK